MFELAALTAVLVALVVGKVVKDNLNPPAPPPLPKRPAGGNGLEPNPAAGIMRRYNDRALIASEGNVVCMIEDHMDPDGRLYRMEYQSTPDGQHAIAWCRHNPWGPTPNAGAGYSVGHISSSGLICMGANGHGTEVARSTYRLDDVIRRGRFWCTAFSVFKETGSFPNL